MEFFNQRFFLNNQVFATNFVNCEQSEVVGVKQRLNNLLEKAKNCATALLIDQRNEAFAIGHLQNAFAFEKADSLHHNSRVHIVGEQVFVP